MSGRRYEPLLKIASGGTASVWVGTAAGALGFRQLVAIKRPHQHLADDPAFVEALLAEAKIAARLRHANAVDVRDVEVDANGVQLVMDWVEGASLSDLIRAWQKEPPPAPHAVAIRVVLDACEGLRALHELTSEEDGRLLGCVHRDVSPANILVGLDGVGRITDFGLARPLLAVDKTTSEGALRGKLGYMAPEYIAGRPIDQRVDVFATGVVLWEALARKRLFRGENDAETLERVQRHEAPRLVDVAPAIGDSAAALDALLARALAKEPAARIGSIAELGEALEAIARESGIVATHAMVRESFGTSLRATIEARRRELQQALPATTSSPPPAPEPAAAPTTTTVTVRPRRATWPIVAIAGGLLLAVGSVGGLALLRPAPVSVREPHAREPDVQSRNDDVRTRDPLSAAEPEPTRTKTRPRPSASDAINKAPRPNPYPNAPRH